VHTLTFEKHRVEGMKLPARASPTIQEASTTRPLKLSSSPAKILDVTSAVDMIGRSRLGLTRRESGLFAVCSGQVSRAGRRYLLWDAVVVAISVWGI
jgi:hypothetical protein